MLIVPKVETIAYAGSCLTMNQNDTFTIWVDLEDQARNNFLIEPSRFNGENVYKVLTESQTLGILHKTFEETWECIQGIFTLQDAERLGDEIDQYGKRLQRSSF